MKDILKETEKIFRYILSGVFGLGLLYLMILDPKIKLIPDGIILPESVNSISFMLRIDVMLVLAIVIGMTLYLIQRYVIISLIDLILFICGLNCFAEKKVKYSDALSEYLKKRFDPKKANIELSGHLLSRHAHIHALMLISLITLLGNIFILNNWIIGIALTIMFVIIFAHIINLEKIERKIFYGKALENEKYRWVVIGLPSLLIILVHWFF
ncbi:hypothetical protein ACFL58_01630 [Elusimicrobiota bacterium]